MTKEEVKKYQDALDKVSNSLKTSLECLCVPFNNNVPVVEALNTLQELIDKMKGE